MFRHRSTIPRYGFAKFGRCSWEHLSRGVEDQRWIVPEPRLDAAMLNELRKHEFRRALRLLPCDPPLQHLPCPIVDCLHHRVETNRLVPDIKRSHGRVVRHVLAIRPRRCVGRAATEFQPAPGVPGLVCAIIATVADRFVVIAAVARPLPLLTVRWPVALLWFFCVFVTPRSPASRPR